MYKKILVTLDGSPFSECSLPHMKAIALGCKVPEVVLLRVVTPLSDAGVFMAGIKADPVVQVETSKENEATDYISKMVQKLKKEGIVARGDIINGNADQAILDYAERNQFDLIIMSTHGRSGVSRWTIGSVADRVLRHSKIPVLQVTPLGCRTSE